jgi:hypothetical protein
VCLFSGHFRLVLVLDEAPEELVALVKYLESVTDGLLIDLVAVSAYELGGSQVVIPQRVDAERQDTGEEVQPPPSQPKGRLVEDGAVFAAVIEESPRKDTATSCSVCTSGRLA